MVVQQAMTAGAEGARLRAADSGGEPWRRWGPYVAARSWGTVREDYSWDSESWTSFPHDHARSRAYRWAEPVFRRRDFFQGRPITGDVKDIYRVSPAGREMQLEDWGTPLQCLGVLLVGEEIGEVDDDGAPISGSSFLLLLNAAGTATEFLMPERLATLEKRVVVETAAADRAGQWVKDSYRLDPHSAAILLVTRPAV